MMSLYDIALIAFIITVIPAVISVIVIALLFVYAVIREYGRW